MAKKKVKSSVSGKMVTVGGAAHKEHLANLARKRKKTTPKRKPKKDIGGGIMISDSLYAKLQKSGLVKPKKGFARTFGEYPQSGSRTSRKADSARTAIRPGWRVSKSGNLYFENRRNRSDRGGKKL